MNMMSALSRQRPRSVDDTEARLSGMIEYLRSVVLGDPSRAERFHAVFLDRDRRYVGDSPLGLGNATTLTLRMRDLFGRALAVGANAIIVAHNHPSGHCQPSKRDIDATGRLATIAAALDIELLDHLIFTRDAVYSMRAGGDL